MSDLRVGQRVKVVAPDPNGGIEADRFLGCVGVIAGRWSANDLGYEWSVDFERCDGLGWPFTSQELAPLDESTITITVDITTYRGFHATKVVSIDPGVGWADRASYELQRIEREVADEMDGAS